jgi:uncharacterized membrane protein YraQ (UPF0718 family)
MAVCHALPDALNVVMDILAQDAIRAIIRIYKKALDVFLVSKGVELAIIILLPRVLFDMMAIINKITFVINVNLLALIVMVQETTKTPSVASVVVLMDFGEVLAMVLVQVEQHS